MKTFTISSSNIISIISFIALINLFLLPIGPAVVIYSISGWVSTIIAVRTKPSVQQSLIKWSWLWYVQFLSVPVVGYICHTLIHYYSLF